MKILALLALLAFLLPTIAQCQPADWLARTNHMTQECRLVMARGVCRVQNGPRLPDDQRAVPWRLGYGLGTVLTGAYMDIQDAGAAMCDRITPACTLDWDSDQCRVVRSLWRQQ